MRLSFGLILYTLLNSAFGQTEDLIFLKRYLTGQDKESVAIPITSIFLLKDATRIDRGWWMQNDHKNFTSKPGTNLLVIEMLTSEVPKDGPWGEHHYGALQVAIEFPEKSEQKIELAMVRILKGIFITNYFATSENEDNKSFVSGLLKIKKGDEYEIDGEIAITSDNPFTLQKIDLKKYKTKGQTLTEFREAVKEKQRIKKEQEDRFTEFLIKTLSEEHRFYDSLFNSKKFPKNSLKATARKGEKPFKFDLNKSYILPNSTVGSKSKDIMKLLGGDIFQAEEGNDFLINLHHFNDPDTSGIDDETNYSVLVKLPNISTGTIDLSNENSFAKLGYWHYGAFGHVIESTEYQGQVIIKETVDNVVTGTLNITFKDNEKNDFVLTGSFQLPIVDRETFKILDKRIEKIADQMKR